MMDSKSEELDVSSSRSSTLGASGSALSLRVGSPSVGPNTSMSVPSTSKKRKLVNSESGSDSAKKNLSKGDETWPITTTGANWGKVYQFKVVIKGSKPPIWRRFLMPENATFFDLHIAIQGYMGWADMHLHTFGLEVGEISVEPHSPHCGDKESEKDAPGWNRYSFGRKEHHWVYNERKTQISDHFQVGQRWRYWYDFRDDWIHTVLLEKIVPAKIGEKYPKCITGRRGCPNEGCGPIEVYHDLLERLKNGIKEPSEDYLDRMSHLGVSLESAAIYEPCELDDAERYNNEELTILYYEFSESQGWICRPGKTPPPKFVYNSD